MVHAHRALFENPLSYPTSQDTRPLHHSPVHRHLLFFHRSDHLHLHCFRRQRKPRQVHPIPRPAPRHRLRLLRQLHPLLCQSLQSPLCLHRRHLLHLEARRQFRNHLYVSRRRLLSSPHASLHVFMHSALRTLVLSQRLRHPPRHRHPPELRIDVQEQKEKHLGRERTVTSRPRRDRLHPTLRQQYETRLRLLARQV